MLQHRLSRNMHITLRTREYVIEKRLPDRTIRIKDVLTDQRTAMPEQELIDALFEKNAELLGHNRNQDVLKERLEKTRVCDIATLKEDDPRKKELQRRLAYVEATQAARVDKRTEETLKPIIEKVASLTSDHNPPSTATLYRWLRFYDEAGRDARALVPATKARGNRKRRFLGRRAQKGDLKNNQKAQERAARVAELIDNAIDEVYLKDQRFTVRAVHDALIAKIDDANRFRDLDDQLPLPNMSSLHDLVNKLDDYDVIEARYGKKMADEKYRAVLQGARPTRPLERVECDHTTTDLFVVDPVTMLPIGRAFLTWMIDVYTKMILGFYISFNPPSYLTVMECLKHAIRPKTYVRRKYSTIRNDWGAYGIPEVLVVDNAREFHGRNLEDACHQLGIVLQYSPRGKPWIRTTVERSYRTIATQLHHQMPGTTFSNIIERADYEPGKTAIITPDVMDEITHKWIADIYQVSAHRGIRDVPALRWGKGIAEWPPALPVNSEFLDVALGYTEERVVSNRGIELDNLFYNDEELAMVRRTLDPHKKVIVKRDPSDLSLIHVYDEKHLTTARRPEKGATSVRKIFGPLYQRLYNEKYLPSPIGIILRREFENYVLQRWDHGYVCSHKWFIARVDGKYLSRVAACTILKLDAPVLENLITKGKLKGLIRSSGRRRVFLVEAASVETLKAERERYLTVRTASKLLGIMQLDVLRLVDNSLLNAARGPSIDNHDTWHFERTTIDDFLSTVFTRIVECKPRSQKSLRGLNDVLVSLTIALSSVGWGVQHLVRDILEGAMIPRAVAPSKNGLARLLFSKQEIKQYLKTKLTGKPDETFRLDTEGRGLPFKPRTLHFLAHKKLIETKVKTHKGLRCRMITRNAILIFTSKYVAAGSVAREVGTRTEHLIQVLKSHKVYPISGPSIDGGPQYFLRRTDLAALTLKDLGLRLDKRKRSHTVNAQGAAKILSLTKGSVVQLVRNGTLRPYSESGKTRVEYLFNRTYVERLRGQFSDLTNLLSPTVAAEILQLAKTKLYKKWIRTGYLRYETSKDRKTRFLVKSTVDRIACFMNSIVTRAEASALLGVPWYHVERFVQKGLLRPVRNPYRRAYWNLTYSRADVENLRGSDGEAVSYTRKGSRPRLSIRKRNPILATRLAITRINK